MNTKEVKFKVELEITTFIPPELDTDAMAEWFNKFIAELGIDLPEDTPEELYFMTRVIKAKCVKYGKAELT